MKVKELISGNLFKLSKDSRTVYELVDFLQAEDGTVYYCVKREKSSGKTGFYLTDGEKEVEFILPF
jgi:hypothetical protein